MTRFTFNLLGIRNSQSKTDDSKEHLDLGGCLKGYIKHPFLQKGTGTENWQSQSVSYEI